MVVVAGAVVRSVLGGVIVRVGGAGAVAVPQQRLGGEVGAQLGQGARVAGLAHRPGQVLDPVADRDHVLGAQLQGQDAHAVLGEHRVQAAAGQRVTPRPGRVPGAAQLRDDPGQPGADQRVAGPRPVRQRRQHPRGDLLDDVLDGPAGGL